MDTEIIEHLSQSWPLPSAPRPIVVVGAGGIVNDAHLPAYRKASFPVAGIFDVDAARAQSLAEKFGIPRVFASLAEATAERGAIFDIAVPPEYLHGVLEQLPAGAAVLMQKPMGRDLADARRIRQVCRDRRLTAAVNFQLRFSPMMLAVRDAIARGLIGDVTDLEFRLHLRTRWELFPFLKKLDRVEILIHSVHYLDWIRSVLGEPRGVYARTVQHPAMLELKNTKSTIVLDYGNRVRCALNLNHNYEYGGRHEAAEMTLEGTRGAAVVTLGLLLNYPEGKPETVEIVTQGTAWTNVPVTGQWFPDAFVGRMANLQRYVAGEDRELVSDFEDAYKTMALVEACYESDAHGATPIPA